MSYSNKLWLANEVFVKAKDDMGGSISSIGTGTQSVKMGTVTSRSVAVISVFWYFWNCFKC